MKNTLLLILATAIWGLGFAATRWTLFFYSPLWSNSLRYLFAGIVSIFILSVIKKGKLTSYFGVFICSLFLFLGLASQTIGIAHTSLAKSGFLTALYAIFTPLFLIFKGEKISFRYWLTLLLAMVGIALMCELKIDNLNKGDGYIIISAVFLSAHILAIEKYGKNENAFTYNLWQCVFIGIIGLFFTMLFEPFPSLMPLTEFDNSESLMTILGFVILVIFSSIVAFGIQVSVQKKIKPHLVSLIFLTESVFASIFGYIFFDESLSLMGQLGAVLILLSVFLISRINKKPLTS
jgi:drug/metabolite transporter (DMT)-like permease